MKELKSGDHVKIKTKSKTINATIESKDKNQLYVFDTNNKYIILDYSDIIEITKKH